jgi:DeoR family transcriptional regulator, suf operon transcriptional repressor
LSQHREGPVDRGDPAGADEEPPLDAVPPTRRAILVAIKRNGSMTAQALAGDLGISVPAVRQQLGRLQEDGLVAVYDAQRRGRGRPTHRYVLAPAAEALFPKRYGDLTTELLGYLGGPESEEVRSLFDRRRQRRLSGARSRLGDLPLQEQVAELTRILDEDGYLADVERLEDGSWRITEHNCAILTVATGFRQACSSELAFIREALPAAQVERVAHLLDGAHVCAYAIRPRR